MFVELCQRWWNAIARVYRIMPKMVECDSMCLKNYAKGMLESCIAYVMSPPLPTMV